MVLPTLGEYAEFALGFAFGWALMDLARYFWRRWRNKP